MHPTQTCPGTQFAVNTSTSMKCAMSREGHFVPMYYPVNYLLYEKNKNLVGMHYQMQLSQRWFNTSSPDATTVYTINDIEITLKLI